MKNKKAIEILEEAMRDAQTHRTIPSPSAAWQSGIMDAVWQEGSYHSPVVRFNRTNQLLRRIIIMSSSVAMIAVILCGYEYYRSAAMIEYQALNDPAKLTTFAINK